MIWNSGNRWPANKMWFTVAGTAPDFCFRSAPVFPFNLLMMSQQKNRVSKSKLRTVINQKQQKQK
jgi:hypothetical protein